MSHRPTERVFALVICITSACGMAFGQDAEPAAKFTVADVHPSPHSMNPDATDMSGGLMHGDLYQLRRATMLDLIVRLTA